MTTSVVSSVRLIFSGPHILNITPATRKDVLVALVAKARTA